MEETADQRAGALGRTLCGAMSSRKLPRLSTVLFAFAIALAACGSSDEATVPDVDEAAGSTTEETTDTTSNVEPAELDGPIDDRSPRELAIEQLDLMLLQLGTVDLIPTSDCVVERLDSEGFEIEGQGGPEIVAALGCDPTVGNELFSATAFNVGPEQGSCIVDGLISATSSIPLADAETFFSTPVPPDEVLEAISSRCDVPVDVLTQGFGA